MNVIKRNGSEESLTKKKIYISICKANENVLDTVQLSKKQIQRITDAIYEACAQYERAISVDEVEDLVEKKLMESMAYEVVKQYIYYRFTKKSRKQKNTTDDRILSLINDCNEEIQAENANKNPTIISTQRDYMAGETSKDLARRYLLPPDIVDAHDKGIIHFHDMDYSVCHSHNCDVFNLNDMLQNGTVISGTKIDKPRSFSTACNITTQIVAQVASSQYGGQTFTLTHLAPFVDVSRQRFYSETKELFDKNGIQYTQEQLDDVVKTKVAEDIRRGVEIIQYQLITLMTTNGQSPFVSVFMYLNECEDEKTKEDLALIIEEVIKQRIKGVKNVKGTWIAPTFPKLLYVLEEDNIHRDSKYYYLTRLAAECVSKRMVPDFISEKIMKKLKVNADGSSSCYPCMGCVSGNSTITIKYDNEIINDSFEKFYELFKTKFVEEPQTPGNPNKIIYLKDVQILDSKERGFVNCEAIIKNISECWYLIELDNGSYLRCTSQHPWTLKGEDEKQTKDLSVDDICILEDGSYAKIKNKISIGKTEFSYDVITETEHFSVNGIYTHNCRSFLTPDRFSWDVGNVGKALDFYETLEVNEEFELL